MKKQLILPGLLVLANLTYSQNNVFPQPGPGNAGIGTTSPGYKLDVVASTLIYDDGIRVTQNSSSHGGAWLYLNNTSTNGRNWGILSSGYANGIGGGHFSIYDLGGSGANRFFIQGGSGKIGIGSVSPLSKLHVESTVPNDGISIVQNGSESSALHLYNTTSGGNHWAMFSTGGASTQGAGKLSLYQYGAGDRLLIDGSGNVGVGSINPFGKFHVETSTMNDGINIVQSGTSAGALHMYNTNTGGQHWALFSTGSANTQGPGNFSIFQYGGGDRIFVSGTTGNVGINTINPANGRLEIRENLPYGTSMAQTNTGVYSDARSSNWTVGHTNGIWGIAGSPAVLGIGTHNIGVRGESYEGMENYGGHFYAQSGCQSPSAIGLWAKAVFCSSGWAAYFDGAVNATGGYYSGSDRKLKDNIKPITSALDKIARLNAYTYTYKTDEYKGMSLPKGQQMGVIAQELEQVFPELIGEVAPSVHTDSKGEVIADNVSYKTVNYLGLIPVLIAGMQEQQARIDAQQKQLDEQKELISNLQRNSGTTGINDLTIEADFHMSQNEPNPFTHETVVKYAMPATVSNAFMAVYDLTGKQITTFPITEKGSSSITITSEKLAAGIYIYSIVADGKVMDSKRMIVAEK